MLHAISPVDGRYAGTTSVLSPYFSEAALIRYRCLVEIEYLIALAESGYIPDTQLTDEEKKGLRDVIIGFSDEDVNKVKAIESTINHDVKAIEYFVKEKLDAVGLGRLREWVHFGLTSQDINNTAFPLMIRDAAMQHLIPAMAEVATLINHMAQATKHISMLAHTHGQPASPTTLGKELKVFSSRLEDQLELLRSIELKVKFGGATGNFNAHLAAFPDVDWYVWADNFTQTHFGIQRYRYTTQIEPYDRLAAFCHGVIRINTILVDFCRDIWTYISMNYLAQKAIKDEVGSSAMPHKVNPIDFENAEGNLMYANAIFGFLAEKLPVSRLQRDLTDSTVLRNIGVPFAHSWIALNAIKKGLAKITPNEKRMRDDLDANWSVLAEAIQTILRREGVEQPYELLKELTRGKASVTRETLAQFIDSLPVRDEVKANMKRLTPNGYTGIQLP